jgi:hypothetical protein
MLKAALVGAVALAIAGTSLVTTAVRADELAFYHRNSVFISEAQIRRFKAQLRLNVEQERHWPAVAAALRNMRLGNRAAAIAANAFGLSQIVSAARPLFHTLDDEQKRIALRLVQSLGFGAFVAAL